MMGEEIQKFLDGLGVPRGLKAVGYKNDDIAAVSDYQPTFVKDLD